MKKIDQAQQRWLELEMHISEGICLPDAVANTGRHPSGRLIQVNTTGEAAFILGNSAGGLRAAAWLDPSENPLPVLQQAVRQLLPLVVVADPIHRHQVVESGAFVLRANTVQELMDFTLIAHHVAEQALVPGAVLYAGGQDEDIQLPDDLLIRQYLGDADDRIAAPSEAQQMLFGKSRRRIPRTFHVDLPVLSGVSKSNAGLAYEAAARQAYFFSAVDEFLNRSRDQFTTLFGRKYHAFKGKNTDRHGILLISDAPQVWSATENVKTKSRLLQVELHQLHPLPIGLQKIAEKAEAVVTIEAFSGQASALAFIVRSGMAHCPTACYSACYVHKPQTETIQSFLHNIENHQVKQQPVWLDVPFFIQHSGYPKKQVLMQDVQRAYPDLPHAASASTATPTRLPEHIPMILRKNKDHGPAYARATHFFDTTAFFYEGNPGWTADPFQAMPVMPPATAAFGQENQGRRQLPVMDTSLCTGCGECLIHCPHTALPSLVASLESLLQSGIQQAQAKGQVISQLFPQVKNLAKVTNNYVTEHREKLNSQHLSLAQILTPAFEEFLIRGKHPEERENILRQEFSAIMDAIGLLPAVITRRFFNESYKELFSITVDPSACTGCAICSAVCPERALQLEEETPSRHKQTQQQFALWEHLPDTSGDTIQRMVDDPDYPSLAALMLSRNFYESLAGASAMDEPGIKTMIHMITAVAETTGQEASRAMLKQLEAFAENLKGQLKSELNNALPDLDATMLARSLEQIQTAHLTLDEFLTRSGGRKSGQLLDKAVLQRKGALLHQVEGLRDLVASGASGHGRARYAIALDDSLPALATFPVNSFTVPVMTFSGATPAMALGLIQAHVRHILDNVKIIRRAELEQSNRYNPVIHDHQIAGLSWQDLSETEKSLVPPLLLIARQSFLQRQSSGPLAQLLDQGLPVKVFLLDDARSSRQNAATDLAYHNLSLIPFLGLDAVQVGQHSLADADHLFKGLISALGKPGAAVLRLLTPDFQAGNPQWLHELANNTRAWVHLDYRPDRHSQLMVSRLHLRDNPAADNDWTSHTIKYGSEENPQTMNYELTPADWYYVQPGYRHGFGPYQPDLGNALPVADYLRLDPGERKDQVPVILRVNEQGELVRHTVPSQVVDACVSAARSWRLLREIAGELAEFPEKLLSKVEADLKVQFEKDKETLIKEHTQQIQELEAVHLEKMRTQIKARLMQMAGWNA
ncbi:MAG: 4Fe-4S binding protein [Saprospiraceae bacterium]